MFKHKDGLWLLNTSKKEKGKLAKTNCQKEEHPLQKTKHQELYVWQV